MVFQFYALYPALTVRQNIMFPLHYEKLDEAAAARVAKVADILHLQQRARPLPNEISEGEKQRVAVARAVVRDPNCFLFDEPLEPPRRRAAPVHARPDQVRPRRPLQSDGHRHA